jgi:1-deoxy-D-xylulose-5-phosphate synthase
MAISSQLANNFKRQHIAIIGDASIASGMAFEALNHAGVTNTNLLVILNDNAIGIDPSVGALKKYLLKVTLDETPNTDNIFEALNFNYSGPIDGHNLNDLVDEFNRLKKINGPKLLHIITKKGKGLKQAEENQVLYHAPGKFNAVTGEIQYKNEKDMPSKFQDVFGKTLVELATINKKIIGITPAMPTGSSLKYMMEIFPERAFDVGIAEQHAVTFSAGMASQGNIVFCNIYSTFLQRAYDQLIHDVCLQNLPVIFCLDRAGLVGEDGATHHGVFDMSYLRCIPNLIIFAPRNEIELRNIMYTAQLVLKKPIAIRYPRGRGKIISWRKAFSKIEIGKALQLKTGKSIAVLTIGSVSNNVIDGITKCQDPKEVSCYDMRFVKPIDEKLLHHIFKKYNIIITIEDGILMGGFGSAVNEFYVKNNYKKTLKNIGIIDEFVDQGTISELKDMVGISERKITQLLNSYL